MKAVALAIPVAFAFSLAISSTANAAPNPETCEGYPEPRVFMENQTWVEPQPGDSQHPGTGEQGHIHMFTCFPLNQRVSTDTIEFDVLIHLHNFPGEPKLLIWRPYLIGDNRTMGAGDKRFPLPDGCEGADCSQWVHIEYDLASLDRSGWTHFQILYKVALADGTTHWFNINRWPLFVDNGKPESTATTPERLRRLGGDTWLGPVLGSNYSEAYIDRSDYPWNAETGKLIPLSGVWNIDASFCCGHNNEVTTGFASIDPHLHAQPEPDLGRVVYDGPAGKVPLSIDTTVLNDGVHRLLLSACDPQATETLTQCGVLVVRFLVDNTNQASDSATTSSSVAAETTTPASATTTNAAPESPSTTAAASANSEASSRSTAPTVSDEESSGVHPDAPHLAVAREVAPANPNSTGSSDAAPTTSASLATETEAHTQSEPSPLLIGSVALAALATSLFFWRFLH